MVMGQKNLEEKFRQIIEAAPNGIVLINNNGKIVLVNQMTESLFGYSRKELMNKPIEMLVPERFRAKHPGYRDEFFRKPEVRSLGAGRDLCGQRKDGKEIPIEIGLCPIQTQEGLQVLASIIDISGRKRTDQIRDRLATIVNSLDDAIIGKSLNGTITSWNKGAVALYGFTEKEAVGQSIDLIIPDKKKAQVKKLLQAVKEGRSIRQRETVCRRKDGGLVDVALAISPIFDDQQKVVGASLISHDISEIKKSREEIQSKNTELKKSNAELEQFAYVASHDLQEPLRIVVSYMDLLQRRYKDQLDETGQRYIQYAVDSSRRMQKLIVDLLRYSRIGRRQDEFILFDVKILIDEVLEDLKIKKEESKATIQYDHLPQIVGERSQCKHLFQNLISNSLKFMSSDSPHVLISAVPKDDKWLFSVKDNGIGFDQKFSEKIFGMFERLHEREKFEGTGIGLALCRKIVENHGGAIWAESMRNQGTTIFFTISTKMRQQEGEHK